MVFPEEGVTILQNVVIIAYFIKRDVRGKDKRAYRLAFLPLNGSGNLNYHVNKINKEKDQIVFRAFRAFIDLININLTRQLFYKFLNFQQKVYFGYKNNKIST